MGQVNTMPLTIAEAFDLPAAHDISALEFVIRLEDPHDEQRNARLVRDYVLTPKVAEALPDIFAAMKHMGDRGEELGRFVHGSFGSGKSHFMALLGLLLEGHRGAWDKVARDKKVLDESYEAWVGGLQPLVVRLHLLTVNRPGWGLDRAIYEAANRALARRGLPPFEFLNVTGVLDEMRRGPELFGRDFWTRLCDRGVVESEEAFEELARGAPEEREALVREYLKLMGREAADAGIDPNWAEGLQRLAAHVKAQGHGAIVLLVDELLLWLKEKTAPEFRAAINQLNVLVDHADGQRAVPLFAFVAQQRNLEEFFPDLVDEHELHEHLSHHSKRFEQTTLEDEGLRHVVKERVLKVRPAAKAEVEQAIAELNKRHGKILPTLLHGATPEYLRDVYPFHPALIEMLIDISSLMQRDRTALRLLFELLVRHYPTLPIGELLPVGRAFDAIFLPSGIDASKRVSELRAIHATYYQRLAPAMRQMVEQSARGDGLFDEGRREVLDQIVKTVLLAEVSPRLKAGAAMTVERLVKLNDAVVEGELERARTTRVRDALVELSRLVPALQVNGSGGTATVTVVLQGVNFGELLDRARSKVAGSKPARLKTFKELLKPALGLDGDRGELKVSWRKTTRRGWVEICNVREQSNATFKAGPGEEFRLLVDYPWDDPGFGAEADLQKAREVNKREGRQPTVCWLPRHFTPSEMASLGDLVAIDYLLSPAGVEELLQPLAPADQVQARDWATRQRQTLEQSLVQRLASVYVSEGQAVALVKDFNERVPTGELDGTAVALVKQLLDLLYPQHPPFRIEPKREELQTLGDWLVAATMNGGRKSFDTATELRALRDLGEPLELVQLGQTSGSVRTDTRYLKAVLDQVRLDSVVWDSIDRALEKDYALQPAVRNFFLDHLVRAYDYRAVETVTGQPVEVKIDGRARENVTLRRAQVVSPAEWSRARELGTELLGVASAAAPSLVEQDRFVEALGKAAEARRQVLLEVFQKLGQLDASTGARAREAKEGVARLAPLVQRGLESAVTLREWIGKWPAAGDDGAIAVKRAGDQLAAAREVNEGGLRQVKRLAAGEHEDGQASHAHLGLLTDMLATSEAKRTLLAADVKTWNRQAEELVSRALERRPVTAVVVPPVVPPSPTPVVLPIGGVSVVAPVPVAAPVAVPVHEPRIIAVPGLRVRTDEERRAAVERVRGELERVDADIVDVQIIVAPRSTED